MKLLIVLALLFWSSNVLGQGQGLGGGPSEETPGGPPGETPGAVFADRNLPGRVRAYLLREGVDPDAVWYKTGLVQIKSADPDAIRIQRWRVPGVPEPTAETLPSPEDTLLILEAYAQAQEQTVQDKKPLGQRQYENMFFTLTEQLLTLFEDERAGQTPPVKLGFPELQALLEQFPPDAVLTKIEYSLNLLTIDSALKRYDLMWWDNATVHVLEDVP